MIHWIGLRTFYRKPPYFMGKLRVSCRCPNKTNPMSLELIIDYILRNSRMKYSISIHAYAIFMEVIYDKFGIQAVPKTIGAENCRRSGSPRRSRKPSRMEARLEWDGNKRAGSWCFCCLKRCGV